MIPSGPELCTDAPNHCPDLSSIWLPDALLLPETKQKNHNLFLSQIKMEKSLVAYYIH